MNVLGWYVAGVVTLPACYFAYGVACVVLEEIGQWRAGTCYRCGQRLPWGPRIVQRIHSRRRHGLAVTMRGRRRRKQWHGMAWWYARKHGATREQWEDARRAAGLPR